MAITGYAFTGLFLVALVGSQIDAHSADYVPSHLAKAKEAADGGKWSDAASEYNRVLLEDPQNAEAQAGKRAAAANVTATASAHANATASVRSVAAAAQTASAAPTAVPTFDYSRSGAKVYSPPPPESALYYDALDPLVKKFSTDFQSMTNFSAGVTCGEPFRNVVFAVVNDMAAMASIAAPNNDKDAQTMSATLRSAFREFETGAANLRKNCLAIRDGNYHPDDFTSHFGAAIFLLRQANVPRLSL